MSEPLQGIFDDVIEFPDLQAKRRFDQLVGLDEIKTRLLKEGSLLLNPALLDQWSKKHYQRPIPLVQVFRDRPPLFLFGGDVGTGKTTLAKNFGDPIAREHSIGVKLYSLSLNARGTGAVGEMTRLISSAFDEVRSVAKRSRVVGSGVRASVILLIDEADALAQSREFAQMHHEDRAGVNALIRGIDSLSTDALPVLVVMCTNRLDAIDPAIQRRAAAIFDFHRPNEIQRRTVLRAALEGTGFSDGDIAAR